jgi:hypothetical protein
LVSSLANSRFKTSGNQCTALQVRAVAKLVIRNNWSRYRTLWYRDLLHCSAIT